MTTSICIISNLFSDCNVIFSVRLLLIGGKNQKQLLQLQREIGFLTVHSMLHLLGYDHEAGGLEMVRMREKEESVLASLGLERDGSYVLPEDVK